MDPLELRDRDLFHMNTEFKIDVDFLLDILSALFLGFAVCMLIDLIFRRLDRIEGRIRELNLEAERLINDLDKVLQYAPPKAKNAWKVFSFWRQSPPNCIPASERPF